MWDLLIIDFVLDQSRPSIPFSHHLRHSHHGNLLSAKLASYPENRGSSDIEGALGSGNVKLRAMGAECARPAIINRRHLGCLTACI